MTKQEKYDRYYMNIAFLASTMSYAERKKVGAILVKNETILADGWNGMPSGWVNICEVNPELTKPEVIHAEMNIFSKLARSTGNSEGSTLYVTLSPCPECAKLIIQSKISRVVYLEEYRIRTGVDMLEQSNIKVEKMIMEPACVQNLMSIRYVTMGFLKSTLIKFSSFLLKVSNQVK